MALNQIAATEVVLLLFLSLSLMGCWDGLIRRRISLLGGTVFGRISFHGGWAILIGCVCLVSFLSLLILSLSGLAYVLAHEQPTTHAIVVLFTAPFSFLPTALVVVCIVIIFVRWSRHAFEIGGPYRHVFLAPGIWYDEHELVNFVNVRLDADHQPAVNSSTILAVADTLKTNIRVYHDIAPNIVMNGTQIDPEAIADIYLRSANARRILRTKHLRENVLRTIAREAARYTISRYAAAEEVWPWRKRFRRL